MIESFAMSYSLIDRDINKWVLKNKLGLITEFSGRDDRFVYLTNSKNDTYQIAISPPNGEEVDIAIYSVELMGRDEDVEIHIGSSVKNVMNDLDDAYDLVNKL